MKLLCTDRQYSFLPLNRMRLSSCKRYYFKMLLNIISIVTFKGIYITSDRLHSKNDVLSWWHSCGTEGWWDKRHSFMDFFSYSKVLFYFHNGMFEYKLNSCIIPSWSSLCFVNNISSHPVMHHKEFYQWAALQDRRTFVAFFIRCFFLLIISK